MPKEISIPKVPEKKMEALSEIHDAICVRNMGKRYFPFPYKNRISSYGLRALDISSEFIEKEFDKKALESSCNILNEYVPELREYEKQPGKHWDSFVTERDICTAGKEFAYFLDDSYIDTLSEIAKKAGPFVETGFKSQEKDHEFSQILSGLQEYHGNAIVPLNKKVSKIRNACQIAERDIYEIKCRGLDGFYRLDEKEKKEVLGNRNIKVMWKSTEAIADKITSRTIFHPIIGSGGAMLGMSAAAIGSVGAAYSIFPPSEEALMQGSIAYWQYANPAIADAMATDMVMHVAVPMFAVFAVGLKGYLDADSVVKDRKNLKRIEKALSYNNKGSQIKAGLKDNL